MLSSTSWLEFFGPGVVALDVVDVLVVGMVDVVELLAVEDVVGRVVVVPEEDRK